MDSGFATWRLLIILAIPVLLIVGVLFLKRALWPRRRGNDPHCAVCDYLLIGNVSGRCPECGRDLTFPSSIRLGQRYRRPGLGVVAILLLLLSLAMIVVMATGAADQIHWYQYRPAAWVVQDMASSNAVQANRAWNELDRRRKSTGGFSPAIEQKLITLALKDQGQPIQGPLGTRLVEFLGDMFLANKLSKAQADVFFTQAMSLGFIVRPIVIIGDDVPYTINSSVRIYGSQWWYRVHTVRCRLDDQIVPNDVSAFATSGDHSLNSLILNSHIKITTPGKHAFEVTSRIEFYHGPFYDVNASKLSHTRTVMLATGFQAVESDPADCVKLVADPVLKSQIQKAITIWQIERIPSDGHVYMSQYSVDRAPANIAFEVYIRADGKESCVGQFAVTKYRSLPTVALGGITDNKADIIFRSSKAAARRTTDLFEIWAGEIVFEGRQAKPSPK